MTALQPSYARRMLVPALFTLAALAVLLSLGMWQLDRKVWKENLIAALDRQMAAAPVDLPPAAEWASLSRDKSEFRRVTVPLEFIREARPAYLYSGGSALRDDVKQPGFFVFAPAKLPDGRVVVVNRGYVGMDRTHENPQGPTEITGFLRWPESPSWFVSAHDTKGDIWFLRDPEQMARERGWGEVAPFYIDQEGPMPESGAPRPGRLTVKLRNDHLGYALTWFGLAITLVGVFIALAVRERYYKAP